MAKRPHEELSEGLNTFHTLAMISGCMIIGGAALLRSPGAGSVGIVVLLLATPLRNAFATLAAISARLEADSQKP